MAPETWIDIKTASARYNLPVPTIRRWCLGDRDQAPIPEIAYRITEVQRPGKRPYRRWLIDESTLQPVVDRYRNTGRSRLACVA